ncbi:MAG: hypothetical protein AAF637_11820 [Pseudomonadota bacterium]
MSQAQPSPPSTLALSTKVEEDFVAPLTSLRGALEILRDIPDLSQEERARFLGTALRGCARLEQSVEDLAKTVYAAGQSTPTKTSATPSSEQHDRFARRVHVLTEIDTIEIDFGGFTFDNTATVNEFYDVIEAVIEATGRSWYLVVNYRECSIWPEAWVAFAHRGKRLNATLSLGTVRYADADSAASESRSFSSDPDMYASRDAALARIEEIRLARSA